MRFVVALVALFVSSYAFSDRYDHHKVFEGEGRWVSKAGDKGNYHVDIVGFMFDDRLDIIENYMFEGDHKTFRFTIQKLGNGFADIMRNGVKIGSGYCFKNNRMKVCHLSYTSEGYIVEKTCHLEGGMLKRIGSVTGEGKQIRFADKLRLLNGVPDHDHPRQEPCDHDHPRQEPCDHDYDHDHPRHDTEKVEPRV